MKAILVILAALTLSACSSTQQVHSPERDISFEVGKTRYSDIVRTLGEPDSFTRNPDGSLSLQYFESKTYPSSESKTSYGTFRDTSEVQRSSLLLAFDKDERLRSYSCSFEKTLSETRPASARRYAHR